MPLSSDADLADRLQRAATYREQIQAWRARATVQQRIDRARGIAALVKERYRHLPEPFQREEWSGQPNFACRFCWYATLDEDVAWLHYQQRHPGAVHQP